MIDKLIGLLLKINWKSLVDKLLIQWFNDILTYWWNDWLIDWPIYWMIDYMVG